MNQDLFTNTEEGREAFTALSMKAIQWIREYYSHIETFPVRSQVTPGEIYSRFADSAPSLPVTDDEVFRILNEVILPGITHWQHPSFYAFFPGNTSFPSIVAEMITAGIAAQCMIWESSPAAAELEQRCMEWCRDLLGLPGGWEGAIQDTASTATLTALLTAREWKSGFRIAKKGFDGTVYRIYTSTQAHSSVEKAVRLAGFGTDNLVKVGTDEQLALHPGLLDQIIAEDIARGYIPLAIVSTIGTTATGAVDPVAEISRISRQYGIWHHVDAAYAGTALMLEEFAYLRSGLDGVDSFVFNPHKWMFVQFDCTAYYVRDPELLVRTMSIQPSYLMTAQGDTVNDYRDWGIPLGRRFRSLKLWMTLQLLGTEAIKGRIRKHIGLARQLESWISAHPYLELAYARSLNIVTFRFKDNYDPEGRLIKRLSQVINDSGQAYMTHAVVEGRGLLRCVTGQTYTDEQHLDKTTSLINTLIAELIQS